MTIGKIFHVSSTRSSFFFSSPARASRTNMTSGSGVPVPTQAYFLLKRTNIARKKTRQACTDPTTERRKTLLLLNTVFVVSFSWRPSLHCHCPALCWLLVARERWFRTALDGHFLRYTLLAALGPQWSVRGVQIASRLEVLLWWPRPWTAIIWVTVAFLVFSLWALTATHSFTQTHTCTRTHTPKRWFQCKKIEVI